MGTITLAAETPLPQQLARLDSDRLRAYRDNLDFYHGQQWLEGSRSRGRDRRLTLNYARTIVEKTASYTMSNASFVVDPDDDSPEAIDRARRTECVIREVYEANGLEQLDFDTEIDCSVLGDAAYKVWWDTTEERASDGARRPGPLRLALRRRSRALLESRLAVHPRARRGGGDTRPAARAAAIVVGAR